MRGAADSPDLASGEPDAAPWSRRLAISGEEQGGGSTRRGGNEPTVGEREGDSPDLARSEAVAAPRRGGKEPIVGVESEWERRRRWGEGRGAAGGGGAARGGRRGIAGGGERRDAAGGGEKGGLR